MTDKGKADADPTDKTENDGGKSSALVIPGEYMIYLMKHNAALKEFEERLLRITKTPKINVDDKTYSLETSTGEVIVSGDWVDIGRYVLTDPDAENIEKYRKAVEALKSKETKDIDRIPLPSPTVVFEWAWSYADDDDGPMHLPKAISEKMFKETPLNILCWPRLQINDIGIIDVVQGVIMHSCEFDIVNVMSMEVPGIKSGIMYRIFGLHNLKWNVVNLDNPIVIDPKTTATSAEANEKLDEAFMFMARRAKEIRNATPGMTKRAAVDAARLDDGVLSKFAEVKRDLTIVPTDELVREIGRINITNPTKGFKTTKPKPSKKPETPNIEEAMSVLESLMGDDPVPEFAPPF